uniref:Uncharacterized protein n=1 Tax=Anguilla anguilla TaxID=7936 RepID=A0A0E9X574_ANGAN
MKSVAAALHSKCPKCHSLEICIRTATEQLKQAFCLHVNHHGYCHHDVWPILLHLYHCNLRDCSGTQTGKQTLNPAASGPGSGCQENQHGGRTGFGSVPHWKAHQSPSVYYSHFIHSCFIDA